MKDESALNDFLQDEVNLNQTRYDNAQDRLKTLRNHLRDNLKGFDGTEIQGSYATRTVIKPVGDNDGYDIDLMVYIKDDGTDPTGFIERVAECLSERKFYADHLQGQNTVRHHPVRRPVQHRRGPMRGALRFEVDLQQKGKPVGNH